MNRISYWKSCHQSLGIYGFPWVPRRNGMGVARGNGNQERPTSHLVKDAKDCQGRQEDGCNWKTHTSLMDFDGWETVAPNSSQVNREFIGNINPPNAP